MQPIIILINPPCSTLLIIGSSYPKDILNDAKMGRLFEDLLFLFEKVDNILRGEIYALTMVKICLILLLLLTIYSII